MSIHHNDPARIYAEDGTPTGWWVVARDPHDVTYYDEDRRAMDETNWDAMVGSFDSDTSLEAVDGLDAFRGWFRDDVREVADWGVLPWETMRADDPDMPDVPHHHGAWRNAAWWAISRTRRPNWLGSGVNTCVLIVREDSDAWGVWEDIAKALSDYPLLDEDAYSQRDHDAWMQYAERDWSSDMARDITSPGPRDGAPMVDRLELRGVPMGGWVDDDGDPTDLSELLAAWVEDHPDAWQEYAMGRMSDWHGFTGEYDQTGAVDAVEDLLTIAWIVCQTMARVGGEAHKYACGIVPLPLGW